MKLIVGLGNPGKDYENTRHNIGYMVIDHLTDNQEFKVNKKFKAMEFDTSINGERIMFIKPLTFMNLSGESVAMYVNYYKIKLDDILVIQDDLDMPIGKYKLLFNRGDGGHNGIKSINASLNSRKYLRLKVGISKATIDTKDYVLGKFTKKENKILDDTFTKLNSIVLDYLTMSKDILMGKYNSKEDI